jgi:hypothetical protein
LLNRDRARNAGCGLSQLPYLIDGLPVAQNLLTVRLYEVVGDPDSFGVHSSLAIGLPVNEVRLLAPAEVKASVTGVFHRKSTL